MRLYQRQQSTRRVVPIVAFNRYNSSSYGRFMTPDRALGWRLADPGSLNRYAYTRGDPVNRYDPQGTDDCSVVFADASQPSNSPCSGAWSWCPNFTLIMAIFESPDAATFAAQALAMGCGTPSAFAVPVATSAPTILCDLQLFMQPAGSSADPFMHTYVGLITQINGVNQPETYYEAGSISKSTGKMTGLQSALNGTAWLNTLDGSNPLSHAYTNTSSTMVWQTGFSSAECPINQAIQSNAASFPPDTITYSLPSPDSNRFTCSLLTMSGVSIPWYVNQNLGNPWVGTLPGLPLAPGWGTTINW
jgi:RHS repeat-associated protein